jgi:glucose/arabinose dehydrogenase
VAAAAVLPAGFQDSIAFSGLSQPTSVRFASDGRVFVAEKSGLIKLFASLSTPTSTVFADLTTSVYNFWDRGLLGLALDPNFPTSPYVYVLYTYDAAIGGSAPRWGTPGVISDPCPTPPGATTDGCVVSGRLSRLTAAGNVMLPGSEQVLINDWCQQFPSHSAGSLAFGADGALYASAGEGASFLNVDYGQWGYPPNGSYYSANPCGDPVNEGGALRSQDLRTGGDPVGLDGAIIRVDPATGAGLPTNPLAGSADANERRIVASGLRNPFRFAIRPGTNDLWIGDVGMSDWDEIDRVENPTAGALNFGWPCYEGTYRHPTYEPANLPICTGLYAQSGAETTPFYAYPHSAQVVPGEICPLGSSSIAGMAFNTGGAYPQDYDGALFFADYSRNCIWAMHRGATGLPDPANIQTFVSNAAGPVDLLMTGGELYYVDFNGGTIRRIRYSTPADPNLALGRPVTASSVEQAGLNASSVVDGDLSTRWSSGFTDPQWIYVDLGATYSISRVILQWEVAYGSAYKIQVSPDATSWTDIFSTTTGDGSVDDLAGLSGSGRYVRMYGTARGTGWGYSLWEFEIYSSAGGVAPTVTSISPTSGPSVGGTAVTITGTGFSTTPGATTVKFGATSATAASCSNSTSCVATSPAGSGTVDVTVTVGGVTSATSAADRFTYIAGNSPPTPTISVPLPTTTWKVGDVIAFSGGATDPEEGTLPPSALTWSVILHHCPSTCHTHPIQTFSGVSGGSFTTPDHDYPSYVELELAATDSGGLTAVTSLRLEPQTVSLTFQSFPTALQIVVGSYGTAATPFSRTVIAGSQNSISAPTPQSLNGQTYQFVSWSDGGAQTHTVIANAAVTYTATFLDITSPTISSVRSAGITASEATIRWATDEPADSRVEYGLSTAYGSSTPLDLALVTTHSQRLIGLRAGTTYHYRVISRDAAGNVTVSGDRTFKTKT